MIQRVRDILSRIMSAVLPAATHADVPAALVARRMSIMRKIKQMGRHLSLLKLKGTTIGVIAQHQSLKY